MAKTITFETGVVDYEINGVQVSFNPTDELFVLKMQDAFGTLDSLQDDFVGDSDFSKFVELDEEMREIIDSLLGKGIADKLFPDMNCYAIAGGLPVWMNLVIALLDEVSEAYEREFGESDKRLKAINSKYDAMMKKYRKPNAKGKR